MRSVFKLRLSAAYWLCGRTATAPTAQALRLAAAARRHGEDVLQRRLDAAVRGDKLTFWLAPAIAMSGLLLAFIVIPIVPGWVAADLNIGLLFFFAMAGLAVYAVMFAGWSSNKNTRS